MATATVRQTESNVGTDQCWHGCPVCKKEHAHKIDPLSNPYLCDGKEYEFRRICPDCKNKQAA